MHSRKELILCSQCRSALRLALIFQTLQLEEFVRLSHQWSLNLFPPSHLQERMGSIQERTHPQGKFPPLYNLFPPSHLQEMMVSTRQSMSWRKELIPCSQCHSAL